MFRGRPAGDWSCSGWLVRVLLGASTLIVLSGCAPGCRRSPQAQTTAKADAALPPVSPTAAAQVPAAMVVQVPRTAGTRRSGWMRQRWPRQPIDVLVRADAPGRDPSSVDAAVHEVADRWRALPGVEHVLVRAREGELRAVVRFGGAVDLPQAATQAVADAWAASPPAELAPPQIIAIPKGNRTRIGWAVTSFDGGEDATARAEVLADWWVQETPGAARAEVSGAVRPVLFVDVLTRSAQDLRVALGEVTAAVREALAKAPPQVPATAEAETQNRLQAVIDQARVAPRKVGPTPGNGTELSRVVALRRGLGGPVRTALVGRNEAVLMRVEAGIGPEAGAVVQADLSKRQDPTFRQTLGDRAQVYPQTMDAAYRLTLEIRPGATPETTVDLGRRLLAVRELPGIVGVVGVQGWDGIPEVIQPGIHSGARWTVWVTVSAHNVENLVSSIAQLLSDGPWVATQLPSNLDTALAWALDESATAGVVLAARNPALLAPAVSAVVAQIQQHRDFAEPRSGPGRRPASEAFARLRVQGLLAAQLPADEAALAVNLLVRQEFIGLFGGADVWLGLPSGQMAAEHGTLPLSWTAGTEAGKAATLADAMQVPSETLVLERIRWDGVPVLWLLAGSAGPNPATVTASFRDCIERAALSPGLTLVSWTVRDTFSQGEACTP